MTERNRLKKTAHEIAALIWDWDDRRSRARMYEWLYENRNKFGEHYHIRHMDKLELRRLINELRVKLHMIEKWKQPIKVIKKKKKKKDKSYYGLVGKILSC